MAARRGCSVSFLWDANCFRLDGRLIRTVSQFSFHCSHCTFGISLIFVLVTAYLVTIQFRFQSDSSTAVIVLSNARQIECVSVRVTDCNTYMIKEFLFVLDVVS